MLTHNLKTGTWGRRQRNSNCWWTGNKTPGTRYILSAPPPPPACNKNTGMVYFVNVDGKPNNLIDTSILLVARKYGEKYKEIKCYQCHKIEHYASVFPDIEGKDVSEGVHLLTDGFSRCDDNKFYCHIREEGISSRCILLKSQNNMKFSLSGPS